MGHHSTSDDSFAYRARSEVESWKKKDNPLSRMRRFLESQNWWDEASEQEMKESLKQQVMEKFRRAEQLKRHSLSELFTDVYGGEMPWNIVSTLYQSNSHTNLPTEGTARRVVETSSEVWQGMGALEERTREV